MKRKIIVGLLITVMALAVTACKNPTSSEDKGTAPVLKQVFIADRTNISEENLNWNNLLSNKTHDFYYYPQGIDPSTRNRTYSLCIECTDPDLDVTTIEISYDNNTYHTFYDKCSQGGDSPAYRAYGIGFGPSDLNQSKYYIRLKDAKNNVSNVIEYNISVQADPNFNYSVK